MEAVEFAGTTKTLVILDSATKKPILEIDFADLADPDLVCSVVRDIWNSAFKRGYEQAIKNYPNGG